MVEIEMNARTAGETEHITTQIRRVRIQGTLNSNKLDLCQPITWKTPQRHAKNRYEMEDTNNPRGIMEYHGTRKELPRASTLPCLTKTG